MRYGTLQGRINRRQNAENIIKIERQNHTSL